MADEDLIARLRVTGQAAFRRAMGDASKGVRGVGSASRTAAGYTRDLGSSARGAVSPVKALLGLGAGWALVSAFRSATEAGFGFNKMIDSQRVGFTTLLGSADKAEAFMGKIQKLALQSPVLDPGTTGDAARLLMAYGIAAKQTLPFVKALGDMSAATGKDVAETLPRAAMAIGQISSKGTLQAEEMNQLAESVGLSRKAIRKELGLTQKEFEKAFTPGHGIKAEKALPAIMRAMEKQSGGAAKRLSRTTAGRLDALHEVFRMKMGQLTRGAYDQLGSFAAGLTKRLQAIDPAEVLRKVRRRGSILGTAFGAGRAGKSDSETAGFTGLSRVAVIAGRVFAKVSPVLAKVPGLLAGVGRGAMSAGRQLWEAFKPMQPFLRNVLLPFAKGVAIGIGATLVGAFKVAVVAIRLLSTALGWIGEKAEPIRPIIQGVGVVFGALLGGPILKGLSWIPKVGKVFEAAGGALTVFGRVGKVAGRAVAGTLSTLFRVGWKVGKFFVGPWLKIHRLAFGTAWKVVSAGGGRMISFLGKIGSAVKTLLKVVGRIGSAFGSAFRGVAGFIGSAMGAVVAVLTDGLNTVIGFINRAISVFNRIPGHKDIPLLDPVGGPGKVAAGTGDAEASKAARDAAKGRRSRRKGGTAVGQAHDPRRAMSSAARLGPAPLPAGDAGLFTVEVPVKIHEREIGRASARVSAKDRARRGDK